VTWRGAVILVSSGWRVAVQNDADVSLCLLPKSVPKDYCSTVHGSGANMRGWLLFYAADRRLAGDPGFDRKTFSGKDMDSPGFDSAPRPCDAANIATLRRGNNILGGRASSYSKFRVTCKKGQGGTFVVQRWLLTESRLGVISYAVTPAAAATIDRLVSAVNLAGFQPTEPS
jgi:hypothetical protein